MRSWDENTPRSRRLAQRCRWAVLLRSGAELITSFLISRPRSTCPGPSPPASNFPVSRGALKCTFEKTFAILREKDCVKSEPPSL